MLTKAANNPKHPDVRIQALAAIGTLGVNARAEALVAAAMKDPDVDVRTAAVLAAGQTKNPNLTTNIRNMLDDKGASGRLRLSHHALEDERPFRRRHTHRCGRCAS
jgi:HEAT repeat protein